MHSLEHIAEDFQDSEKHYLREENVLFPFLEKHGVTEPPSIMWIEHNQIREKKKELHNLTENPNAVEFQHVKEQLGEIAGSLSNLLSSHFFKESNILFPTALQVITDDEWKEIRKEFDEIGYCCFTPTQVTVLPETEGLRSKRLKKQLRLKGCYSLKLVLFRKRRLRLSSIRFL